ncbi:MAG: cyclic nucleotide-binding domain-containing protein [Chloroflexota bacterium]
MTSTDARLALLKKIHLFNGFNEDNLKDIAGRFSDVEYAEGEVIFEQGSKAEAFFLIVKGRVNIVRKKDGREHTLAYLVNNDYFGEMALVSRRPRSATVTAMQPTAVLALSLEQFDQVMRKHPHLKDNLYITIRSRVLAQKLQFKWLRPKEVVYFLARKHIVLLYQALVAPALTLLLPIGLAALSLLTGAVSPVAVAVVLLVLDMGWAGWRALDWSNDYYVVTNERVVWLEKVVGIYDSRQEAPLSTILSVSVETDPWGRIMDYGNVVVRTFVGQIPFNYVTQPGQAARVIEEYWDRTKQVAVSTEKEAMKNAIRKRLGLAPVEQPPAAPAPAAPSAPAKPPSKSRGLFLKALGASTFKLRYETGDTVIYRKHWVVLWQQAWQPFLLLLLTIMFWIGHIVSVAFDPLSALFTMTAEGVQVDTLFASLPFLMIPLSIWLGWQVVDWSNDIFQVTPDQIIDIDRKPFGGEERRAAQLESILSTQYKREGLLSNVFNFGTVYITVGGTELAFEDVMDPATVQSDIDRRRMARTAKTNEARIAAERDRMAEWLASYHINADEFRRDYDNRNKNG